MYIYIYIYIYINIPLSLLKMMLLESSRFRSLVTPLKFHHSISCKKSIITKNGILKSVFVDVDRPPCELSSGTSAAAARPPVACGSRVGRVTGIRMYICTNMCVHSCTYTYVKFQANMRTHILTCMCIYSYVLVITVSMHTYLFRHLPIYLFINPSIHLSIYLSI